MRAPEPFPDPATSDEIAFQLAQIAKAARHGHASAAAAAQFRRRAHANLVALSSGGHPNIEAGIEEGESAWLARQRRSA
jgi:ABC-type Fe3+ transport system substrate-binding protein